MEMSPSLFPYISLNILWHERIYALIQWSLADPYDYKPEQIFTQLL